MAMHLNRHVLPARFLASAEAHQGFIAQADVATFDAQSEEEVHAPESGNGVAVAVWAPA